MPSSKSISSWFIWLKLIISASFLGCHYKRHTDFSMSSRRSGLYKVDETVAMRGCGVGGQGTAAQDASSRLCTRTCVSWARAARAAGRGWRAAPLCRSFFAPASIIRGPFGFLNGINFSVDFTWQAAQRPRRREIISFGPRRYRCPPVTPPPLRPVVELESALH